MSEPVEAQWERCPVSDQRCRANECSTGCASLVPDPYAAGPSGDDYRSRAMAQIKSGQSKENIELDRDLADASGDEALVEALREILSKNQERSWTATRDNPETHWEVRDGQFAKIARAALAGKEPRRNKLTAPNDWTFKLGQRVTKKSGSRWTGKVVGFYSTSLTPEGYAIESETEEGSVQIYPVKALKSLDNVEPYVWRDEALDPGLKNPVRPLNETFNGFAMLRRHFGRKK